MSAELRKIAHALATFAPSMQYQPGELLLLANLMDALVSRVKELEAQLDATDRVLRNHLGDVE